MFTAFKIADGAGRRHSWFDGFRARHLNLTLRSTQSLSHSRVACGNREILQDYFAKLAAVCARLNILSKPMNILYNVDETGLSIVHKPGRVVAELGSRNVWSITSAGKNYTVLSCVSASGYALPPFMIYPQTRIREKLKVFSLQ